LSISMNTLSSLRDEGGDSFVLYYCSSSFIKTYFLGSPPMFNLPVKT
jgi:hypothetical protein